MTFLHLSSSNYVLRILNYVFTYITQMFFPEYKEQ